MKKILITGSSGFIAKHIIDVSLNKNWQITCVDKIPPPIKLNHVHYLTKDVRSLNSNDLKGIDYIAHMAFVTNIPKSIKNPILTTRDNIEMTAVLLDKACKNNIQKFVFPSTASLFGNNPIPWSEDMPADPIEPYSWQKLSCEHLLKMWNIRYGLNTSSLRLFQVYGENQRNDTALAAFIKARKENKVITLTETTAQSSFKTGRRDFVYVKDVAKAFINCMESKITGKGEIINIGSGKMTSMEEIALTIGGKIEFIPKRNFEVECHQADTTKARKLLNWSAKVEVIPWLTNFIRNMKL